MMIAAMLLSSELNTGGEEAVSNVASFSVKDGILEDEIEKQDLRYLGGFIARKFPNYAYQGEHMKPGNTNWVEEITRNGKLLMPSEYFLTSCK